MTTDSVNPYENGDIIAVNKPRNLDELLKLDTYQGMTDDEIRLVIAYKESRAMQSATIQQLKENADAAMEEFRAKWADIAQRTQDNFERAMTECKPTLTGVSDR